MLRIHITSVFVDDQAKALAFYVDVLGFVVRNDIPMGDARWLTVGSRSSRRRTPTASTTSIQIAGQN